MINHKPLLLVRNKLYSNFQLIAEAVNNKTPSDDIIKISILTTLQWLRSKFRKNEMPKEIIYPEPENYMDFKLEDFKDIRIDNGFVITAIYLPDIKNWSFQLIEPDLGSEPGNENANRKPVPGRIFTTNIALRCINSKVQYSFETVVSEPENTMQRCEVYRIGVIKKLMINPLVGLKHIWILENKCKSLDTIDKIRSLKEMLNNEELKLPVVAFAKKIEGDSGEELDVLDKYDIEKLNFEKIKKGDKPYSTTYIPASTFLGKTPFDVIYDNNKPITAKLNIEKSRKTAEVSTVLGAYSRNNENMAKKEELTKSLLNVKAVVDKEEKKIENATIPYDIEEFLSLKAGFALFAEIDATKLEDFNKIMGENLKQGDICFLEPIAFGGGRTNFKYNEKKKKETIDKIDALVTNYPVKKVIEHKNILFINEARIHQRKIINDSKQSISEIVDNNAKTQELLKQKFNEETKKLKENILNLEEKKNSLSNDIARKNEEIEELKNKLKQQEIASQKEINILQKYIDYIKSKEKRPKLPVEIPQWVAENFNERLFFHDKAVKLINAVPLAEINMDLLCDAIEFLAEEYWDYLNKKITKDEMRAICSKKYGRPFEVSPSGETTVKAAPIEYKVKYNHKEVFLSYHLKTGVSSTNLIRIYFFYDSENGLVVIGSLPRHLKTIKKF